MTVRDRTARRIANLAQQPRSGWYRVVRNDGGAPTRVDIYDEIGGSWFFGGVSAADFVAELAGITGDLEVHINSPGGDVWDGLAIYNAIAQRPGNVTTVVDGLAASAASFIALAGSERVIAPGAMMMIHDASGVCFGNAGDMRELAGLLDKVSGNIASLYATHSGQPDGWREAMTAETWYTAQEAIDAGLADKLAERPAAPDAAQAAARWARELRGEAPRRVLGIESMPLTAKALPVHHTATEDGTWDGPAAVKAMPNDDTVLEYCHAWQDSDAAAAPHKEGDDDADDQKGNYKFPHHRIKGGPANLAACRNGLARLSGADIPDGDRAGVKAHLQAHLDDAGKDDDATDHADMPAWLRDA